MDVSGYGDSALELISEALADGVGHAAVLLRHSARTFEPGLHDLDNLLTDEGRALCCRFGRRLPKELTLRAYASPAQRCLETAQLILEAHEAEGGSITRHRPVEALGVFYALDQMKMWKGMEAVGGMANYLQSWLAGTVPADAMMPAHWAARLVLGCMAEKLAAPVARPQLDLHVSHDVTLHLLRSALLGEPADSPPVEFLDGLLVWRAEGALWLKSQHGPAQRVGGELTD
ncbi:MAG: histidine phosphatase family protein [Gammaproteobacteria bacterium]|nr:histidine phosphatase family protein [Gammaproteobacteria bacterium]